MILSREGNQVAFFCLGAAKGVSGKIFWVRKNEIFLFPAAPVRLFHRKGLDDRIDCIGAAARFKPTFFPLEISADLFAWDPM